MFRAPYVATGGRCSLCPAARSLVRADCHNHVEDVLARAICTMSASCVLVSFNCAKLPQSAAELESVLGTALHSTHGRPDFVVIALQEAAPILDASLGYLDKWLAPFKLAGTKVADRAYSLIAEEYVGAIALLVFGLAPQKVQHVARNRVQFGMLWSSLKGAVCISLVLDHERSAERLTFVSAHLAANEGKVDARNRDFGILANAFRLSRLEGQVFVIGDLNYRARNQSLDSEELAIEMREGRTAQGFTEAPIGFVPSFKYRIGTSELNNRRSPSWCDRVLFRPSDDVEVHAYDIVSQCTTSDHKPVFLTVRTPTTMSAPFDIEAEAPARVAPVWLSKSVDTVIGSTLYMTTSANGLLAAGLMIAVFFFVRSF